MIRSAPGRVGRYCWIPASRSMRPSWASWSTTTATKVFVTLPTPHATSGSTGPLAGSTVGVPAVASVMVPSRSRRAMRAPTNSPASWWDCRIPSSIASRAGFGGRGAVRWSPAPWSPARPWSPAARRSWPAPRSWSARWPRRRTRSTRWRRAAGRRRPASWWPGRRSRRGHGRAGRRPVARSMDGWGERERWRRWSWDDTERAPLDGRHPGVGGELTRWRSPERGRVVPLEGDDPRPGTRCIIARWASSVPRSDRTTGSTPAARASSTPSSSGRWRWPAW